MANAKSDCTIQRAELVSKEANELSHTLSVLSDDDVRELIRCLTEYKWSTELKKFLVQKPDLPLTEILGSATIETISNSNTFNFVITPENATPFIFKIESRFGNTSAPVEHLKNLAIGDVFLKESEGK